MTDHRPRLLAGLTQDTRPPVMEPQRSEAGPHDDYREDHPAYGMIGMNRITSAPGSFLAGSDFRHGSFIQIKVHHAHVTRGLSQDYWRADRRILELNLSEAQWATFISQQGMGDGVPCTLAMVPDPEAAHFNVPSLSMPVDRREQLSDEVQGTLRDALVHLDEALATAGTAKAKAAIRMAKQEIEANLTYVVKSFDKHAERTVERAKAEVHGYVTGAIQRAGLASLQAAPFLELATGDDAETS